MISVWSDNSDVPSFRTLDKDINTDIVIIGGGIAGILCAYTLDKAGASYVLLEADKICKKTTANTTAKITSQHGLIYARLKNEFNSDFARLYFEANEDAIKEYDILCRDIDCDYKTADSYVYSLSDSGIIEKETAVLNSLGIPAKYITKTELPFSIAGAVKFENQANFNPLKFISHIARGLNIYENSRVTEMKGNIAFTDKHKVTAKKVIVATHFPFINKHGFYFLKMYQERSYVLALENARRVEDMYLDENKNGLSFRSYENLLLLGASSHRTGKEGCGWERLEEVRKKYYPESIIKYRWATQDCITLDGVPYIGRYSASCENLFVATGFNKWGMSSSMVAAKLLCDLVLEKENKYEKIFSPSRSIMRKQLAINTFEAMCGWLSFGKKRCPHLGCGLSYNKYEHTWDCSCHGSRFDGDGRLVDNPANSDIKR